MKEFEIKEHIYWKIISKIQEARHSDQSTKGDPPKT